MPCRSSRYWPCSSSADGGVAAVAAAPPRPIAGPATMAGPAERMRLGQ